jgi:hypothetical protein
MTTTTPKGPEVMPDYTPFATREACEAAALEAVRLLELAEDFHANCDECEGEGVPELCGKCFPHFDAARVRRRLVMQSLAALSAASPNTEAMRGDVEAVACIIEPGCWRAYDNTLRPFSENRGALATKGECFWYEAAYRSGCRTVDDARQWWLRMGDAHTNPVEMSLLRESLNKARAIAALSTLPATMGDAGEAARTAIIAWHEEMAARHRRTWKSAEQPGTHHHAEMHDISAEYIRGMLLPATMGDEAAMRVVPLMPTEAMMDAWALSPKIDDDWRAQCRADWTAMLSALPATMNGGEAEPIPMVLHCPKCGKQHIDEPSEGWDNPPHKSHLCHGCGCIWRPADVPTTGVAATVTVGKADNLQLKPVTAYRGEGK